MRLTSAILLPILTASVVCCAQNSPAAPKPEPPQCGLTDVKETVRLRYGNAITLAAHVEGDVDMVATFATDGTVDKVEVTSGPELLRDAATDYLRGWRANLYPVSRVCQIRITFRMLPPELGCSYTVGDTPEQIAAKCPPPSHPRLPEIVHNTPQHITFNYTPLVIE
jgi:hypothetical protein